MAPLQSWVQEGWFGSDPKKPWAEKRSCLSDRAKASTGSSVERKPASSVSDGHRRDRAADSRALARSVSARARATAGASPAASAAASRTVSASGDERRGGGQEQARDQHGA